MLALLITYLVVSHAALACYCLRLRRQLKAERVCTEALRWALVRSKLEEAGMLPKRQAETEDWPEYL